MILRRINFSYSLRLLNKQYNNLHLSCVALNSKDTTMSTIENDDGKVVSKAMKAYLQRAKEHDEFMKQQNYEYQIGKRHLANMMGEDPETFTQDDVDNAIAYLFPSGLFEKRARPMMKPPEEVFPQRKAAEFDATGRPYHFLFYTGKPNFYKLLYNIVENINSLNDFEDSMLRKSSNPDPTQVIESSGYRWLDKSVLEQRLVEGITDKEYNSFTNAMEKLCSLPYSYKAKDFISQYRTPLMNQTKDYDIPQLKYDTEGRAYITTYECLRKRARGDVTIRSPGTGKITINGESIEYFQEVQNREQTVARLIEACDQNLYLNIKIFLQILATLPVSVATADRWFSPLRRVKSWLCASMAQEIYGLALLNIDKHVNLDIDEIINVFAKKKRKLEFVI